MQRQVECGSLAVRDNRDCFPTVMSIQFMRCIDHARLHLHKTFAVRKLCLCGMFHPLTIYLRIFWIDVVIEPAFKVAEVNFAESLFGCYRACR